MSVRVKRVVRVHLSIAKTNEKLREKKIIEIRVDANYILRIDEYESRGNALVITGRYAEQVNFDFCIDSPNARCG